MRKQHHTKTRVHRSHRETRSKSCLRRDESLTTAYKHNHMCKRIRELVHHTMQVYIPRLGLSHATAARRRHEGKGEQDTNTTKPGGGEGRQKRRIKQWGKRLSFLPPCSSRRHCHKRRQITVSMHPQPCTFIFQQRQVHRATTKITTGPNRCALLVRPL